MAYVMDRQKDFGSPSPWYYKTVLEGYRDCGLDVSYLQNALKMSLQNVPSDFSWKEWQEYFDEIGPKEGPEGSGFSIQFM